MMDEVRRDPTAEPVELGATLIRAEEACARQVEDRTAGVQLPEHPRDERTQRVGPEFSHAALAHGSHGIEIVSSRAPGERRDVAGQGFTGAPAPCHRRSVCMSRTGADLAVSHDFAPYDFDGR